MNSSVVLYRFRLEVSDIDRDRYESLDFRVALHPSETLPYLLTRVLAMALSTEVDLSFSKEGLGNPDEPSLAISKPNGGYSLWIEIGNPSARRLHKATKASDRVQIYTAKDPQQLQRDYHGEEIHKKEKIEIISIPLATLDRLVAHLQRDNKWSLMHQQNELTISGPEFLEVTELKRVPVEIPV